MNDVAAADLDDTRALSRPGRLILWLIAGFSAAAVLMSALPHNPYIRFQALSETIHSRVQWTYERLHFDRTPINVAVIGNSRLGAGVNAPALSTALSDRLGRPVRVANLSTPQEGRNLHYVLAKELLKTHPDVSLILLSVTEQEGRTSHPAFGDLADARDIATAPILINRDWPADLAKLPFRQLSLFIKSLAPERFGMHGDFDASGYIGPDYDTTATFALPDGRVIDRTGSPDPEELRAAAIARVRQITPPLLGARLADQEFVVERRYTRMIADIAREAGVEVAFLYLPIYLNDGQIRDVGFYREIGEVIEARQLVNAPDLFSDYGHLNRAGSESLVPWLADRLAVSLETAQ